MLILNHCAPPFQLQKLQFCNLPHENNVSVSLPRFPLTCWSLIRSKISMGIVKANRRVQSQTQKFPKITENEEDEEEVKVEVEDEEDEYEDENDDDSEGFSSQSSFDGREQEKDYDRDPEFGDILGNFIDDPQKAQRRVEERIRRKRSNILHSKTGSAVPMKVTFNKFDFTNSYIWFEFYNTPLTKDISLICDTVRSWHIIGRLGGCNSMNMQLSQSPMDKRPSYDAIQGANVTPTSFYNIGDLEIQENLARIWVDIGNTEPLLLDVLVNALTQISSDYIGIKEVVFGGSELENWKENLTSEDTGCSVHKI